MPRIDPAQLLHTLGVLLGPNGGIKSEDEVSRLVQLMQKFSKKLVSKVVYIKILKFSRAELLDKFLTERGWDLLNFWFAEAIKTNNWPLCKELIELFVNCPMTAQRLRENSDQNIAPKLVRQLTADSRVDQTVRSLATQVLNKWMFVIQTPMAGSTVVPVRTRARGQIVPPPAQDSSITSDGGARVLVSVHTESSPDEEIVNLPNLGSDPGLVYPAHIEPEVWVGKARSGMVIKTSRLFRGAKPPKPRLPRKQPVAANSLATTGITTNTTSTSGRVNSTDNDGEYIADEDEDDDEDDDDDDDDDIRELLRRSKSALNRTARPSVASGVGEVRSVAGTVKPRDTVRMTDSPHKETVSAMNTRNMNGTVKDELMDIDELLDDNVSEEGKANLDDTPAAADKKPISVLQGLAAEMAETLKKEKQIEESKEGASSKEKKRSKEEEEEEERRRRKRRKEERRRREEKEREREKRKKEEREKERKKQRESRPYKESELVRNVLDSSEREKIRQTAQRLKEEASSAAKHKAQSSSLSTLPKIPKLAPGVKKESSSSKEGPDIKKKVLGGGLSFEELMGAMDSSAKPKVVKAAPIKNKNRDLLASFSSGNSSSNSKSVASSKVEPSKPKKVPSETKPSVGDYVQDFIRPMKTEDKTLKIIPAAAFEKSESLSTEKRRSSSEEDEKTETSTTLSGQPLIKVKPASQLKESPMFGDFLSTIMKDSDQPKKKKMKVTKTREEEEKEKERVGGEGGEASPTTSTATPTFSFYRDTMEEECAGKSTLQDGTVAVEVSSNGSPPDSSTNQIANDNQADPEDSSLPFAALTSATPREVRGILVYSRGEGRPPNRRICWRPDDQLVDVEYFELDETERVNVNKLKFEEMRKKENMLEKAKLQGNKGGSAGNTNEQDSRPWPGLMPCEHEQPNVDYGSHSAERTAQKQRENSVLQALFFNNRLPNDPSEPERGEGGGGGGLLGRGIVGGPVKHIPLEDDEVGGEEGSSSVADYSEEGWPDPVPDPYELLGGNNNHYQHPGMGMFSGPKVPGRQFGGGGVGAGSETARGGEDLMDQIHQNLKTMMGGGGEGNDETMHIAMVAARKAAEEALRQRGLLPLPTGKDSNLGDRKRLDMGGGGGMEGEEDMDYSLQDEPYDPTAEMDLENGLGGAYPLPPGGIPEAIVQQNVLAGLHQNLMLQQGGGAAGNLATTDPLTGRPLFPNQPYTPGESWRRGGRGNYYNGRGHHRGGGAEFRGGRGFSFNGDRGGGFVKRGFGGYRGRGSDYSGGPPPPRRPCKFWVDKGFCREEDRCKFPHPNPNR